jgi:hypothetical protein
MAVRLNDFSDEDFDIDSSDEKGLRLSDPFYKNRRRSVRKHKLRMLPSDWVNRFVRIKDGDTGLVKQIGFEERKYLLRPYNTPARKILFMTSRQTEKSTTLGNKLFAMCGMRPMYETLFVSPSAMQTTVFSRTRIDDIVDISPLLQAMVTKGHTWNILEKVWANKSKIYLRYAFLSADRIRGLSVNSIFCDELQDLLTENMPVIEETASHHKKSVYVYSGTPKTLDNNIEQYWSKASTMAEWAIPCEHHGTPNRPSSWHWIVLGPANLGKLGPICDRCGKAINPEHPHARWVEMNPGAEFEGYRVCRLMVPWYWKNPEKWREILDAYERYPTAQFMNEVLAFSYDAGTKPITRTEVIQACDPKYLNDLAQVAEIGRTHPLYFGIDWGTGDQAYTVLTISTYCRNDAALQVIYMKRFEGPEADGERQVQIVEKFIEEHAPKFVGADYGMGFYQNKRLTSKYGPKRIHQFQYAARLPMKVAYSGKLHRYMVFRTPVMADIFHALKRGKVRLPKWEAIREPFASDILSIYSEYSETMKMIKYDKPRKATDDSFHSILYSVLASFLHHPRPDIIAPIQDSSPASREEFSVYEALSQVVDPGEMETPSTR